MLGLARYWFPEVYRYCVPKEAYENGKQLRPRALEIRSLAVRTRNTAAIKTTDEWIGRRRTRIQKLAIEVEP